MKGGCEDDGKYQGVQKRAKNQIGEIEREKQNDQQEWTIPLNRP